MKPLILIFVILSLQAFSYEYDSENFVISKVFVSKTSCGKTTLKYVTYSRTKNEPMAKYVDLFDRQGDYSLYGLDKDGNRQFAREKFGFKRAQGNNESCDLIIEGDYEAAAFCRQKSEVFYLEIPRFEIIVKYQLLKGDSLVSELEVDPKKSKEITFNWSPSCILESIKNMF